MRSDNFEKAFGNFLESEVYDRGEDTLFALARTAFIAGWEAAKGEPSESHGSFQVLNSRERTE